MLCWVTAGWIICYRQESVSGAHSSMADGGAMGFEVSKSSVWRQSFFISCQCRRAASSINRPLMFKNCRDRIYWDSQLFDTGREKEASQINVFTQRGLTSFSHPNHCSFILIHSSFRQHKHWEPEDVCSMWGSLLWTVGTRFKVNYIENAVKMKSGISFLRGKM